MFISQQVSASVENGVIALDCDRWLDYKQIRLAMLLDIPQAYGGLYEEECLYSDEVWQNYLTEALSENRTILRFFSVNDRIVGMAGAKIGTTKKNSHRATIFSVYVLPVYRRQSIAKKLLISLIEILKSKGITKIDLVVAEDLNFSLNLYQSLHFVIEGYFEKFWCCDGIYTSVYSLGLNLI